MILLTALTAHAGSTAPTALVPYRGGLDITSLQPDTSAWWWQRLPRAGLMREEFEALGSERLDTDARG